MMVRDRKDQPKHFLWDGPHLNRAGHDLWKSVIAPALR
jgi:hypothetical protein